MKIKFLFPLLIGICAAVLPATRGRATLFVNEYDPARHNRFYSGDDRDFIAEGFDLSGVGHTSSPRWVTMISPTYFVTATHFKPGVGDTVTFYEGNVKSEEFKHEYVVDDAFVTFEWGGLPSDLTLGRLVVPDGQTEAISPEDNLAYYPIVSPDEFNYTGADVFVYGKSDVVGMNNVTNAYPWRDYWTASYTKYTYIARYNYDADASGQGPDEAYVVVGDSGAPTFAIVDGRLAVTGTHYFVSKTAPPISGSSYFGDSFVPEYLDQIAAIPVEADLNGDHFVGADDLNIVRSYWNQEVPAGDLSQGDISGDGYVGSADLDIIRSNWNRTGPAYYFDRPYTANADSSEAGGSVVGTVPEPSVLLFITMGAAAVLGLRRRKKG